MINPIARMLGQAEVSIADLSRRTIDSVTTPLRIKSQEIVSETLASVASGVKTIVIKAILGLLAAAMLVTALIYAIAALYQTLLPVLGPVGARLAMAGVFAVVGIAAILAMMFWPSAKVAPDIRAKKAATRATSAIHEAVAADAAADDAIANEGRVYAKAADGSAETDRSVDLKTGFETIVGALGDAGFRREQAGLRAGLALANQLKPMQIVTLALIGGFIAGFRYPSRR